jgi:hypothetical protein
MALTIRPFDTAGAAAAVLATPVSGVGHVELHPLRAYFRYSLTATLVGLGRLSAASRRLAAGGTSTTRAKANAIAALFADVWAVTNAISTWQVEVLRAAGAGGPEEAARNAMLQRAELASSQPTKLEAERALARLLAATSARHAAAAEGGQAAGLTTAEPLPASPASLAVAQETARALDAFVAQRKASLQLDADEFLPWVAEVDRKTAGHCLQQMLFGAALGLRETASVCRWVLRNQIDVRCK